MLTALPLLALSNWGLAFAILFMLLMLGFVAYIVLRAWLDPTLAPSFAGDAVTGWARWRP